MFRVRIKEARSSIEWCKARRVFYRGKDSEEDVFEWMKLEDLYRGVLGELLALQKQYRKEFGYLPFLRRNGHSKRAGLCLIAKARLEPLEKEAKKLSEALSKS